MKIDFNNRIQPIKAMHGVGQPPFLSAGNDDYFHYLTDAHIPYSRLHDVECYGMRFVDIPNIFKDFDADENDPASYDFVFTDWLISSLMKAGCQPIYRLGVSIENQAAMKAYNIYPPKDFEKWARICEHIIRHYNEGWADGYSYDIKYWEIWNEPEDGDGSQMWLGTDVQYFELYTVASKHLKKCFGNSIKVGGYSSCGFYAAIGEAAPAWAMVGPRFKYYIEYFEKFLTYIKKHDAPLDFFSWHSYAQVNGNYAMALYLDEALRKYGYGDVETQLNEWNTSPKPELRGTSFASASAAAVMLSQQNTNTKILCYYDGRIGMTPYAGLYNPLTRKPCCTYYAFKAFGELYSLGTQAECSYTENIYAIAATDGEKSAVMMTNLEDDVKIETNLDANSFVIYVIDQDNYLTETEINPVRFTLKKNQVVLITNYRL